MPQDSEHYEIFRNVREDYECATGAPNDKWRDMEDEFISALSKGEHTRDNRFPLYSLATADARNEIRFGSDRMAWQSLEYYQREIDGQNWNTYRRDMTRAKWDDLVEQARPTTRQRLAPKPILDPYANAAPNSANQTQDHSRRGNERR